VQVQPSREVLEARRHGQRRCPTPQLGQFLRPVRLARPLRAGVGAPQQAERRPSRPPCQGARRRQRGAAGAGAAANLQPSKSSRAAQRGRSRAVRSLLLELPWGLVLGAGACAAPDRRPSMAYGNAASRLCGAPGLAPALALTRENGERAAARGALSQLLCCSSRSRQATRAPPAQHPRRSEQQVMRRAAPPPLGQKEAPGRSHDRNRALI
jgi:hypothetical protein